LTVGLLEIIKRPTLSPSKGQDGAPPEA